MRILLIDNYDSFTYNLYQQIERLGGDVTVEKHDEITVSDILKLRVDGIVISPGPKDPKSSGVSCEVIREFHKHVPILGVCLGHQCIAEVFGAETVRAPKVMHGKTRKVFHDEKGIFRDVRNPLTGALYHSLVTSHIPDKLEITAWAENDVIMGLQHRDYPVFGVQFHPESFLTDDGDTLISNFLNGNY